MELAIEGAPGILEIQPAELSRVCLENRKQLY